MLGNIYLRDAAGNNTNVGVTTFSGASTFTGISDHSSRIQMLAGNAVRFLNAANSASTEIKCDGGARLNITSYNQTMATFENGQSIIFYTNSGQNRLQITNAGNVLIAQDLDVDGHTNLDNVSIAGITTIASGSYINSVSPYRVANHPILGYDNFTDISGGSYATRLGSTGTSTLRSTQIYGGGNHIATFDGVNYRLGIRTTTPDYMIHLKDNIPAICFEDTDGTHGQAIIEQNGDNLKIRQDAGNASSGTGSNIRFETDATERLRIHGTQLRHGSSNVLAGGLDEVRIYNSSSYKGFVLRGTGGSGGMANYDEYCFLFNRMGSDGNIIRFNAQGSQEGSISVSGSSVAYNGGVLTRWSQLVGISTVNKAHRPTIYQGTVMSNLDEMCEWPGEENMQLNKTEVSTTSGDKNVAGVFWAWDDDDDTYVNDFYVAQTGDYIIRVGAATTITRGDLLESAGDGTAKPQSDDIVRSKTVAKVTSGIAHTTYPDGTKTYPCVLMGS